MRPPPRTFIGLLARAFNARRSDKAAADRPRTEEEQDLLSIAVREQKVFTYAALAAATADFSSANKLGSGGFGPVYRGTLPDGRPVAVKRLAVGSLQGGREFKNEAALLSKLQHRNVVNFLGYCDAGEEKIIVYEFVANGSLDKALFFAGVDGDGALLPWRRRFDIIAGVARGLQYLHEDSHTPIIHRDVKASNVLLDERWAPKIADFGIARLFDVSGDVTHVRTRVAGSNGYTAPEYLMHGVLSTKADVFSFGVLVLEIVSGRKHSRGGDLLHRAWKLHSRKEWFQLLDPAVRPTAAAAKEQVELCVHVGLLCAQFDPKLRPEMKKVTVLLSKRRSKLEEPAPPPSARERRRTQQTSSASSISPSTSSSKGTSSSNQSCVSQPASAAVARPRRTRSELGKDIVEYW